MSEKWPLARRVDTAATQTPRHLSKRRPCGYVFPDLWRLAPDLFGDLQVRRSGPHRVFDLPRRIQAIGKGWILGLGDLVAGIDDACEPLVFRAAGEIPLRFWGIRWERLRADWNDVTNIHYGSPVGLVSAGWPGSASRDYRLARLAALA
jgi:hypothetical protein